MWLQSETFHSHKYYSHRWIPFNTNIGLGLDPLQDANEIKFAKGSKQEAERWPHLMLCNLQLAMSCVLCMSGAVEMIFKLTDNVVDFDTIS
jgi:hypothetical protein